MPSAQVLCTLGVLLAAMPAHAREFRSAELYPADYPTAQAVVQMDRLIRERSAGRDGITILGHGGHASDTDTVAQVRNGRLDMARVNISALDQRGQPAVVPALPFLFRSTAHMRRILDGPVGGEILASLEDQGLVGLCFYDAGPRSFYSVSRPIRTAADLRGMKVRVQPSGLWAAAMRTLGAEPAPVPFDDVARALQSGVIEAADNNWPSYVASRHYNIARYFSPTEHSMAPVVLVFSKRVWDGLSRDDQVLIRGAARDSVGPMRKLWDEYEASSRRTVEAAGGEIVAGVDRKSFADALLPLYPTVIDSVRLRRLVNHIQSED